MLSLHHFLEFANVLERTLEDGGFAVLSISTRRNGLTKILKSSIDRFATFLLRKKMRHPPVGVDRIGRCRHMRGNGRCSKRRTRYDAEGRVGPRWFHACRHANPRRRWDGCSAVAPGLGRAVGSSSVWTCAWHSISRYIGLLVDNARACTLPNTATFVCGIIIKWPHCASCILRMWVGRHVSERGTMFI